MAILITRAGFFTARVAGFISWEHSDGHTFEPGTETAAVGERQLLVCVASLFRIFRGSDGRCLLIPVGKIAGWKHILRGLPFNQMMGLPVELTLHSAVPGAALAVNPARELKSLRGAAHTFESQTLAPGMNPLANISGDLLEVDG